jgi:Rrf2 family protein
VRVSQRLDYVLRALTFLAQRETGGPVPVGDIASALNLPRRFLEQQVNLLAKRGIVTCKRGTGGGCELAGDPGAITVGDIVRAVNGQVLDVPQVKGSAASEMWLEVRERFEESLEDITLADLSQRQDHLDSTAVPMYYI